MIVQFTASLPPIASAVNLDGVDGNARIKLDIPSSDLAEVVRLMLLAGKSFKVTIEADDEQV